MADKAIQDLPRVDRLEVDDLLVVGDASNGYNAHAATGAIMRILVKEQASEAVAEIESKVSEASQAATSAAGSAAAAQQYAQNATDSAEQSATSAQQSETSATDAQGYANSASEKATLSQSWAVGGTGSREGEDTDNAKYWAEQAHNAAGGGVVSFNSRTGAVVPQDGDYTPDMVGAVKKVLNPTAGDFPVLTEDGHLQGSGKKPADFAPSGFGLGATGKIITDLNDATSNGWYYFGSGAINTPPHPYASYGAALVIRRDANAILQIYMSANFAGQSYICTRFKNTASGWEEWKYLTPQSSIPSEYIPTPEQSAVLMIRSMFAQQAADMDDDTIIRYSGLADEWKPGDYKTGDIYNADEQTWECYQPYNNDVYPDIKPGNPAWFTFNRPLHGKSPETARPFVPVQGAHDMYHAGEYAVYTDGKTYCCKSDTAYSPSDFPEAWEVYNG